MIPYGSFSTQRPSGPTQYDVNISHPIDFSHKRHARTIYAEVVLRVTENQYQDVVRLGLNNVYLAYVDVLAARQTVRYSRVSVEGWDKLVSACRPCSRRAPPRVPTSTRPDPSASSPRSA